MKEFCIFVSFNRNSLDFHLQEISSNRAHFLKSSDAILLASISSLTKGASFPFAF